MNASLITELPSLFSQTKKLTIIKTIKRNDNKRSYSKGATISPKSVQYLGLNIVSG